MSSKVFYISPEVNPFAKAGGLADVSLALPKALQADGTDVKVVTPYYGEITRSHTKLKTVLSDCTIQIGEETFLYDLLQGTLPGKKVVVYFLRCALLFESNELYANDGKEYLRAIFISRAAIEICQHLRWAPDVFHCNDWQTALIPFYLKFVYSWDELFISSKTILSIHNLGYQGEFSLDILPHLNLTDQLQALPVEDRKMEKINFLRTGILYADKLTTVSPSYAQEIQSEEQGHGIDALLRHRSDDLTGILNGVDEEEWNPRTDNFLPMKYSAKSLWRKQRNKEALLARCQIKDSNTLPLLGIIGRLVWQKGMDLLQETLPKLLAEDTFRLIVLGSGEEKYEEFFDTLSKEFEGRVFFHCGYDNALAHSIEGSCDFFLMPSIYEPCGLNQMYSMKYGTIPVVHRTGGLADTVVNFDNATQLGTGIVFDHHNVGGLSWALEKGFEIYNQPKLWKKLVINAMEAEFSWRSRAISYRKIYDGLAIESVEA